MNRPEYPRMQFRRNDWINLNGEWDFDFDFGCTAEDRGLADVKTLPKKIQVPFCPESRLSGIAYTDFMNGVVYHRTFTIPAGWAGRRILLNFGAVDYEAQVYVDGVQVARHLGSSTPFTADLTEVATPGTEQHLVVIVKDDLRSFVQPGGKQSWQGYSFGCSYTRTTGIWQTVDLECAGINGLASCKILPDFDNGAFTFIPVFFAEKTGYSWKVQVIADGKPVAEATAAAHSGMPISVKLDNPRAWSPEDPFLYDVTYTVIAPDGTIEDTVESYAGLRKIHIEGNRIFLNNNPLYLRMVLDQGFYPDGIWTAPSDEELENDIKRSMSCGFNAARLHQKIFEPRFLYHADKLGYLVWGEFPSWCLACSRIAYPGGFDFWQAAANHLREWTEEIERDFNHPAIITWTPQNETDPDLGNIERYRDYMTQLYDQTKTLDPTRPVVDTSGYVHVKTDIWTLHKYCKDAQHLKDVLNAETDSVISRDRIHTDVAYTGQPALVDEIGGFRYIPAEFAKNTQEGWGYHGIEIKSGEELVEKIREQVDVLLADERFCGYCYTQLTDIEQEQNGLYTYDRHPKAPEALFAKVFGKTREE